MPRGKLIVFEGADGVGKSTQTTLLASSLRAQGAAVTEFSFPRYGTTTGDVIYDLLHRGENVWRSLDWRTRAMFFAADRMDACPTLLQALKTTSYVLLDRYVESNAAYLSSEATAEEERQRRAVWIEHLEYDTLGLPKPDATVLLELSSHLAMRLLAKEREDRDVNETTEYQQRLAGAFTRNKEMGGARVRVMVGNGHDHILPPETVHEHVVEALRNIGILSLSP